MEMFERAQGCLLGALVGDAAGARLEFLGRQPRQNEIDDALAMKGGGVFRVAPGQFTDDGELTLALARALVDEADYPRDKVATNYRSWLQSQPFDVGNATSAALGQARQSETSVADAVSNNAALHNMASKANGSLMRATPLGIWSTGHSLEVAVAAARADARLTHPNLTCQWASAAYVVSIRQLLLNGGDAIDAFAQSEQLLRDATDEGAQEVLEWLEDARVGDLPACHPLAGFVRIAFTHAFHHLLNQTPYEEALRCVLAGGGDTDTNACIVGGLVGARVGIAGIPLHMQRAVIECDVGQGRPRPAWLQAKDALELTSNMARVTP
jgi:ADP-ribosyl-[dinitrogen reductase] hydrolase